MHLISTAPGAAVDDAAHPTRVGALFDAHYDRLYRLARRLSATREDAQDLVQDTFLRAACAGALPTVEREAEAWLVRVLVNVARDQWRRSTVRRLGAHLLTPTPPPGPEAPLIASVAVTRALQRLVPRRRAIVVLHDLEGLTAPEIGRTLGLTAVTVRWHLSRARRELARTLTSIEGVSR